MKHPEEHARLAFDEQRAVQDLQTVQREIQHARGERERAEAEFDAFLRGFRTKERESPPDTSVPPVLPPAPPPRPIAAEPELPAVGQTLQPGAGERDAAPAPHHVDPPSAAASPGGAEAQTATSRRRRDLPPAALAGAGTVAVAAVLWLLLARSAPAPAPDTASPAVAVQPEAAPPPASEASAPAASTPAGGGVNLELVTQRPVWVRVTVDGRRAIERELAAGARIPLHADRAILIRAGDAGALTVSRDGGEPTVLGGEGTVVTRAFTATDDAGARER